MKKSINCAKKREKTTYIREKKIFGIIYTDEKTSNRNDYPVLKSTLIHSLKFERIKIAKNR